MKGQTILLTANSTGDYAVQSCLKKYGLKKADVTIKNMGQAEIISAALVEQRRPGGRVGAEHLHARREGRAPRCLCSGKDGGVVVPGALIARGDYAEQNPAERGQVPRRLPARVEVGERDHKPEAIAMMKKFYEQGGVHDQRRVDEEGVRHPADLRPRRSRLARWTARAATPTMDGWFGQIAIFMRGTGAIQTRAAVQVDFITDEFMKRVAGRPEAARVRQQGELK